MICPHCSVDLKYKERPNRRCSKCKKEFALDPRENPLKMHDLRFRALTEKLSADGSLFYTFPQQHHYVTRKSKAFSNPLLASHSGLTSFVGYLFFILLGLIYLFFIYILPLIIFIPKLFNDLLLLFIEFINFIFIFALIVLLFLFMYRDKLDGWLSHDSLLMTPDEFQRDVVNRWQEIHQTGPQGLLEQQELEQLQRFQPAPTQLVAILVCPQRAVLDCLHANGIPKRLGVGLLPDKPPFTPAEQITLNALRTQPLPLLLLHDASLTGCLLPHTVRESLGVNQQQRIIIDLGIHPRQAIQYELMQLNQSAPKGLFSQIKELASKKRQQAASPRLSKKELRWLRRGFYSPILALPPARLIKIVTTAVERLPLMVRTEQAQQRARAVGFMSWPE